MANVHYAPGSRRAVVTTHGVVVIAAEISGALLVRIGEQVQSGRGLAAVLEALTGAFGTSLTAIPPFVFAVAEQGTVRLAVRGDLSVEVQTASGCEQISGAGVTTWSERVLSGVVSTTIHGDGEATDAPEFPIRDGIVLASALRIEWTSVEEAPARGEHGDADAPPSAEAPLVSESSDIPTSEDDPGATRSAIPIAPPVEPGPRRTPPAVISVPAPAAAAPSLIDSRAVLAMSDTLLPPDATLAPSETGLPVAAASSTEADQLWGETVARVPEPRVAIRDAAPPDRAGDHDGQTISVEESRALRAAATDSMPPLAPPRPRAPGQLRLSTGQVVILDRTVVIGRRPRSTRVSGTDLPHLIAVESPQQDISRSHVEVRVEGDSILVTDLHTTNGTTLQRVGADPVHLQAGERTVVVPGDTIDLGDGITASVEAAS
ncbi:MAG: FHA domain-containing protein [Actinobacteria bacterium]|nr:FHA domain-containing protein [Actinomycetota bacterium]